jgi:hypothetical protein
MVRRVSRTRQWLRLRVMTKVTPQMCVSLDGCSAGPMDPRHLPDAAGCTSSWPIDHPRRCMTWVGDDPDASTNLGFRTTDEH